MLRCCATCPAPLHHQVALQQGLLSLSQALELYQQARVQNLVARKAALLATEPCTTQVLLGWQSGLLPGWPGECTCLWQLPR